MWMTQQLGPSYCQTTIISSNHVYHTHNGNIILFHLRQSHQKHQRRQTIKKKLNKIRGKKEEINVQPVV